MPSFQMPGPAQEVGNGINAVGEKDTAEVRGSGVRWL
jgi:hypothetical protein